MDKIKEIQEDIDNKLLSILNDNKNLDEDFLKIFSYVLELKGKKVRPILMILSYKLFKNDTNVIINQAVAIELFHCFTLIHDDIMDNSDMRRGKETVNKLWGNEIAILAGDVLLVQAYKHLMNTSCRFANNIISIFTNMSMKVCEGQFLDIRNEQEILSLEQYLYMIKGKTAELLATCMEIGALLGEASEKDQKILYEIGINLGIAFQLEDDLLDMYGKQSTLGKDMKNDVMNRKQTFLLIKAMEYANEKQRSIILNYLYADIITSNMMNQISKIYDELDVLSLCKADIYSYYVQANIHLDSLSVEATAKEMLVKFIQFLKNRNY